MCNIGPHLAFALDVRSKGFGRACPSLSTRVICHNIADSKLCSTKGYFVQLLVKSHRCFVGMISKQNTYIQYLKARFTQNASDILLSLFICQFSKDYIHIRNNAIKDPAMLYTSLRIHKDTSFTKLIFISNCHYFHSFYPHCFKSLTLDFNQ